MKNIFTRQNVKIFLVVLLVITVGLTSFYGYNEYVYRKIAVCFSEGNYTLALNYAESISPSYKDLRKIKSLISIINNHDSENNKDAERTYSKLKSLKGFSNENINQIYNEFLFEAFNEYNNLTTVNVTAPTITPETTANLTTTTTTTTLPSVISTTTAAVSTTLPATTKATTAYTETTDDNSYEPTTEYIETTETTSSATTTKPQYIATTTTQSIENSDIVYYVESGEVYHISRDCRTLANSKNVYSGPIPEGRRVCKVCGQ